QEVEKELECMRREYEHVRREYEIGDTRGLPMSVREQYRRKLSKLRKKRSRCWKFRSSTILVCRQVEYVDNC
ncbi:MAG: hypothetical protein J7K48_05025, partial [Thermococcus sp.]|nr:hypothetical protein [Thermococcus sp.]